MVSLPGSGTDTDGTIASYAWTQTVGPTVTLSGANTATAGFTAPTVSVATVLTFKLTVTDNQGATGFDTVNVTVNPSGGGGGNVLTNGVPVTGLAASTGATLNYTFVVPAGATSLTFQISGGSGDADLYVKYGSAPTTSSYDCRPYVTGNNETCAMPSATAGTWYVMVRAYSSFSNVSLVATYTTGGGTTALQNGVPVTRIWRRHRRAAELYPAVPAGASTLSFQISGGSGDADLYVKYGSPPSTSTYDCRPYVSGNNETCAMPSATAGTWYVMVRAYSQLLQCQSGSVLHHGGRQHPAHRQRRSRSDGDRGRVVSLPGSGNDTDGTIASYAWTQTVGPAVTLSGANTATAGFTAPAVSVATVLTFKLTVTDNQGATGFDTVNVTVNPSGGGGGNVLTNGVPVTGLAASTGATLNYTFVVPAGATSLTFQISGGSGDADLYVKYGSPPSTSTYDCRPYVTGNNETCAMPSATAGTWYVMVRAYSSFSNVSLVADVHHREAVAEATYSPTACRLPVSAVLRTLK